ncbi:MAG: lipoate--protein ligase [Rubrivivax sp.]|nr:lipoate--protein ligase [Pseudomonadota bacterium]MCW5640269.1 lipoate--protein ligase [Rubrivivax sp.]HOW49348.1 lipoate--protein ligase [Rubrivivax sp.]HRY89073.1 lipoate--protein ligase [Rubrivivax sp.]
MELPPFGFVCVHERLLADGIAHEAEWMAESARGARAVAHLWQGTPGWVVPRRTTALPSWPAVSARHGSALQVRRSGGGLVPQGPGIWNLSLAWPAGDATPADMHAIYAALCGALAAAFARLGVSAAPQAVQGSFCDGRWNLAVHGRKLVGTAQAWHRFGRVQVVLAHALVIISADPAELTDSANRLEAELGQGAPYRADALTSLAREVPTLPDLEARTLELLAEQFARVVPPREA